MWIWFLCQRQWGEIDTCSRRRIVFVQTASVSNCKQESTHSCQGVDGSTFYVYGLPDQLISDNGKEFVNNLWRDLFSEFRIQHTITPPYNPSSNPVERFHRKITDLLLGDPEYKIIGTCGLIPQCLNIIQWVAVQELHQITLCSDAKQLYLWTGCSLHPL